jgi:hypothetical protein
MVTQPEAEAVIEYHAAHSIRGMSWQRAAVDVF